MGLSSDRPPCVLCDSDVHPQDAHGQCTACRPPERMSPAELQALQRQVAASMQDQGGKGG